MGCVIKFTESANHFEFCGEGNKQKIMVDILLRHAGMDSCSLASALNLRETEIEDICNEKKFLGGEQANDLVQFFWIFFGKKFFRKFSIIRSFS